MRINLIMNVLYTLYITVGLAILSFPIFVFAQPSGRGITVELQNPLRMNTLEELLIAILNLIMILMVPVIVFFIIWAGFLYVTARGNVAQVQQATKALTFAIIGAVIILGAVAISQMIGNTVDQFKRTDIPVSSIQLYS
jgi:hypothetical protein